MMRYRDDDERVNVTVDGRTEGRTDRRTVAVPARSVTEPEINILNSLTRVHI